MGKRFRILFLLPLAAAMVGCAAGGGEDRLEYVNLREAKIPLDRAVILGDQEGIAKLAKLAEALTRPPAEGPAKLGHYDRMASLLTYRQRPVLRMYYPHKLPAVPAHPPYFTIWVYLDDGETKFFPP